MALSTQQYTTRAWVYCEADSSVLSLISDRIGQYNRERVKPSGKTSLQSSAYLCLFFKVKHLKGTRTFKVKHLKGTCTSKVKHLKGICTFGVARKWQPCFLWLLWDNNLFFPVVVDEHYQIPWSLCNHLTSD